MYNYQAFWFGSKPQRKKPNRLTKADDGTGGTEDVTQTGHPIICSHAIDRVPALKCEMFNSFQCCLVIFLFVSEVLVHYNRNLNAAFIKYIKICNVTKPFLCIWNSTQHLHEKQKRWLPSLYPTQTPFHSYFYLLLLFLPLTTYSTLSAHCSLSLSWILSQSFTDWQLDRKIKSAR